MVLDGGFVEGNQLSVRNGVNRKLGKFLNNRLKDAALALDKIEEKILELQIALQTCEEDCTRHALEESLMALTTRMLNLAVDTQTRIRLRRGGDEAAK